MYVLGVLNSLFCFVAVVGHTFRGVVIYSWGEARKYDWSHRHVCPLSRWRYGAGEMEKGKSTSKRRG